MTAQAMSPMLPASARKIPAFILVRQPVQLRLHRPLGGALAFLGAAVGLRPREGFLSVHLAVLAVAVPSEHGALLRRRWRPARPPGRRHPRGRWRWPGPRGSRCGPSARPPGPL